jgi:hypothetical protein
MGSGAAGKLVGMLLESVSVFGQKKTKRPPSTSPLAAIISAFFCQCFTRVNFAVILQTQQF